MCRFMYREKKIEAGQKSWLSVDLPLGYNTIKGKYCLKMSYVTFMQNSIKIMF